MKKIILILLTTTLFSCQVFKKSTKEKSKEETKTETEVKVDSVAEVETEKETKNDLDTKTEIEHEKDSVFENTKTTTEVQKFDSLGRLIEKTTTTTENNKGSLKSNKKGKEETKDKSIKKSKESKKIDLSKVGKSKRSHELSEVKKDRKVEKTSLPNWLWWLLIITGVVFALVGIWKVKKNNFTQFFK
jgi:ABC-type Na+ efflux pump permease subunit